MRDDRLLKRIEEYIRGKIQLKLETLKISFEDLCDDLPEFTHESLKDPLKYRQYRYFISLKNTYKKPVALAIVYLIEFVAGYTIKEIYIHDLVAAEPAWTQGFSGRDIDYIIVSDENIPYELTKEVEEYLDNIVGSAITNYFMKKGKCLCTEPFNKIIKHNLVEIHAIKPEEKKKYGLNGSMHSVPVEKVDIEKYRNRIKMMSLAIKKLT